MAQAHSKYGASSAHRWLNCPGSIQLAERFEAEALAAGKKLVQAESSIYAQEGTAAHKLGEICLMKETNANDYLEQEITLDDGSKYFVTEDMVEAVQIYVDYVRDRAKLGELFIETRFSLGFIHEGMFGTNDACVYSNMLGVLEVIDYKHGAGIPVDPEENEQLAYYGLGAANVQDLHPDSQIKLTIVQPRAAGEPIKSWVTTVGYLDKYAKVLKKGVKSCKSKKPKLKDGTWCRFCPAQALCPQLEKKALEVAKAEFGEDGAVALPAVDNLKTADIKKVLDFSKTLSSWLKSVEAFAANELESGGTIEGYKLVKKRANRKWKFNEEELKSKLYLGGANMNEVFTTPKLKSPAQIEKLVDKNLVASLCETPDTGNTMVPVSDKRPEVLPSVRSDFDVIEN